MTLEIGHLFYEPKTAEVIGIRLDRNDLENLLPKLIGTVNPRDPRDHEEGETKAEMEDQDPPLPVSNLRERVKKFYLGEPGNYYEKYFLWNRAQQNYELLLLLQDEVERCREQYSISLLIFEEEELLKG